MIGIVLAVRCSYKQYLFTSQITSVRRRKLRLTRYYQTAELFATERVLNDLGKSLELELLPFQLQSRPQLLMFAPS